MFYIKNKKKAGHRFYLSDVPHGEPASPIEGKPNQKLWLSPVCVPSVCKLHQQHELDQQEARPAHSSDVAPNCGREGSVEMINDQSPEHTLVYKNLALTSVLIIWKNSSDFSVLSNLSASPACKTALHISSLFQQLQQ